LLMSMKPQVLSVSFRTQGRVDVEPPSVADSLRERATASPRAWQVVVVDVEDEVVEIFSSGCRLRAVRRVVEYFSSSCLRSPVTCRICFQLPLMLSRLKRYACTSSFLLFLLFLKFDLCP
jgi:hypothetical protein